MAAATTDDPPGLIVFGVAEPRSTIHGSESTPAPATEPQPALPGPALQPHQLFSIPPLSVPANPAPLWTVTPELLLLTMRLKPAITSSVKVSSASRKKPVALLMTALPLKLARVSVEPKAISLVEKYTPVLPALF